MEFYSHAKEVEGKRIGSKPLKKHLNGVYLKAKKSVYPYTKLNFSTDELRKLLLDLGIFHDLGKYTIFFQKYLLGEKVKARLKNHSLIGAFYLINKYKNEPLKAAILYFLIINHHKSFDNFLETGIFQENKELDIFIRKQLEDIHNRTEITTELKNIFDRNLLYFPNDDVQKKLRRFIKRRIKKAPAIIDYFTINYLFSLLTEADKLDASETKLYLRKNIVENAVKNYIGKADLNDLPDIESIDSFEQNKLRNWVRASVLEKLKDDDILEHNLFTLTAPTGIGKTLTVLDFALRLKKKISEKENFEPQIIYGLPFINIIEQGLKVYNEVFENQGISILGHYQYADIFGKEDTKEDYNKKLMQTNTWQSDIVITSFVQFFETLISNRNKMLLKFNHFAGAIVILDEVQTLRLGQLPFIGAMLYYLGKYLNTRIILMTATKPKIFELANKEILENENEKAVTKKLLENPQKIFAKFNRTKLVPLLEKPIVTADDFYEIFIQKRKENQSCLIVCNTVQRSIDIFNKLKVEEIENLYYLSTNIVPAVRIDIIEKIKMDIAKGEAPVLVSTQVVEAGVDLDFDMGFRDLAPLDSIIQVAGRINRENNKDNQLSPLYIVQFQKDNKSFESTLIYDSLTREQILKIFSDKTEIPESQYFKLIDDYFSVISEKEAFNEARNFFESVKTLKYDGDETAVSKFKIIKGSPWAISVFIELNEDAMNAHRAYNELLNGEMTKEEFDSNYKKNFNQYIIAVPEKFTDNLENINEFTENIKLVRNENLQNYYDNNTGFIRKIETGIAML